MKNNQYLYLYNPDNPMGITADDSLLVGACQSIAWNNGILNLISPEFEIIQLDVLCDVIYLYGKEYNSFQVISEKEALDLTKLGFKVVGF